jgi:hypothetical protein
MICSIADNYASTQANFIVLLMISLLHHESAVIVLHDSVLNTKFPHFKIENQSPIFFWF